MKRVVSFLTLTLFLFNQVASGAEAAYLFKEQSRLRTPTTASRPSELLEALGAQAAQDGGDVTEEKIRRVVDRLIEEAELVKFQEMSYFGYRRFVAGSKIENVAKKEQVDPTVLV